jgi:hypothetical protein
VLGYTFGDFFTSSSGHPGKALARWSGLLVSSPLRSIRVVRSSPARVYFLIAKKYYMHAKPIFTILIVLYRNIEHVLFPTDLYQSSNAQSSIYVTDPTGAGHAHDILRLIKCRSAMSKSIKDRRTRKTKAHAVKQGD